MTNKEEEKQLRDYKRVIDSIYLIITCGIDEIPPKIKDAQTQFKIDYIRNRLNNIDKYCDNVYAYFFEEYNSVYVGRTMHTKSRDTQHRTEKTSSVFKFANKHNTIIPKMVILERFLSIDEGVKKEDYYCIKFKKEGWKLINVAPTGEKANAVGNYKSEKWDLQKCYFEARKFKTTKEFRSNSPKAYKASVRHGFLKTFDWLAGRQINTNKSLSYEKCKIIALKYDTLKDFMKYDRKVYRFSKNRNWVKDFTWLKREKEHSKAVEQYSLDGKLLNTYKSVNEASRATSILYSRIYNCCNGRKVSSRDFVWKYKE